MPASAMLIPPETLVKCIPADKVVTALRACKTFHATLPAHVKELHVAINGDELVAETRGRHKKYDKCRHAPIVRSFLAGFNSRITVCPACATTALFRKFQHARWTISLRLGKRRGFGALLAAISVFKDTFGALHIDAITFTDAGNSTQLDPVVFASHSPHHVLNRGTLLDALANTGVRRLEISDMLCPQYFDELTFVIRDTPTLESAILSSTLGTEKHPDADRDSPSFPGASSCLIVLSLAENLRCLHLHNIPVLKTDLRAMAHAVATTGGMQQLESLSLHRCDLQVTDVPALTLFLQRVREKNAPLADVSIENNDLARVNGPLLLHGNHHQQRIARIQLALLHELSLNPALTSLSLAKCNIKRAAICKWMALFYTQNTECGIHSLNLTACGTDSDSSRGPFPSLSPLV
jgi:hypothetical protein